MSKLKSNQHSDRHGDNYNVDPLTIPEILLLTFQWLDPWQSVKCLCVCRSWHDLLIPRVWSTVKITNQKGPKSAKLLKKHSHLIQKLHVSGKVPAQLVVKLTCPRLKTLFFDHRQFFDSSSPLHESFKEFLKRHQQTLQSLSIESDARDDLVAIIQGCSNLERLQLPALIMDSMQSWMDLYGPLWSRIRALHLGASWFWSSDVESSVVISMFRTFFDKQVESTEIEDLDLDVSWYRRAQLHLHLQLILKCRKLARLRWVVSRHKNHDVDEDLIGADLEVHLGDQQEFEDRRRLPMARLANAVRSGRFSPEQQRRLRTLELPTNDFLNKDFSELMQALKNLTHLNLEFTNFNPESWTCLKDAPQSLTTLRSLNLERCPATGAVIHDILCSISSLEEFRGDYVRGPDILADSRPWACTRLQHLSLACVGAQGRSGPISNPNCLILCKTSDRFLTLLSSLTSLRVLDLSPLKSRGEEFSEGEMVGMNQEESVSLMLRHGLDRLKNLRFLEDFTGPGFDNRHPWGIEEAMWVLKHWPNLSKVAMMPLGLLADMIFDSAQVWVDMLI